MSLTLSRACEPDPPARRRAAPPAAEISPTRVEGWVVLDWSAPAGEIPLLRLLELNGELPGPVKFCLSRAGTAHLRAEVLTDEDDGGEERLSEARYAMGRVIATWPEPDSMSDPTAKTLDVMALCAESGWPCIERSAGRWMVELEGTPFFCQAEVTVAGSQLDVAVSLGNLDFRDETCEAAIVQFLLRAGGSFRMVRAVVTGESSKRTARLLVRLPWRHAVGGLMHALGALSVAARSVVRETLALQDPRIAGLYLATLRPASA